MSLPETRMAEINHIQLEYTDAGTGPLVVLCHGFPESRYSWRAQVAALAASGYRVIAPNQRGYGRSSSPPELEAFTLLHLAADIVGLVRSLDAGPAAIVGHDWGAPVAWTCALLRPDLFRALALLSVPYLPSWFGGPRPTGRMRAMCGDRTFYQLWFQQPDVPERVLEADIRSFLLRVYAVGSAGRPAGGRFLFERDESWLDALPSVDRLPGWLTSADLDAFAADFSLNGFRGPINWYRNIDRNNELLASLAGRRIEQPSLFLAGAEDGILRLYAEEVAQLESNLPGLRGKYLIPGAGHWVQQEKPGEVNDYLTGFLQSL